MKSSSAEVTVTKAVNIIERFAERCPLQYGYEIAVLEAAFDEVCDRADWKAPIKSIVRSEDLAVTIAAIAFYTATSTSVDVSSYDRFVVNSVGYRAGPAGDH